MPARRWDTVKQGGVRACGPRVEAVVRGPLRVVRPGEDPDRRRVTAHREGAPAPGPPSLAREAEHDARPLALDDGRLLDARADIFEARRDAAGARGDVGEDERTVSAREGLREGVLLPAVDPGHAVVEVVPSLRIEERAFGLRGRLAGGVAGEGAELPALLERRHDLARLEASLRPSRGRPSAT